jgi:hypothetical protein
VKIANHEPLAGWDNALPLPVVVEGGQALHGNRHNGRARVLSQTANALSQSANARAQVVILLFTADWNIPPWLA